MKSVPSKASVFPGRKKSSTRGQASIEYVLLIGMTALVGMTFMRSFSSAINQGILGFNAILEQELTTGNFENGYGEAATQWEN